MIQPVQAACGRLVTTCTTGKAGTYTIEIATDSLKKGAYYIRLLKADKKIYQQIELK